MASTEDAKKYQIFREKALTNGRGCSKLAKLSGSGQKVVLPEPKKVLKNEKVFLDNGDEGWYNNNVPHLGRVPCKLNNVTKESTRRAFGL